MSTSGNDSSAAKYATVVANFLFSIFESMISIMLDNLLATRLHTQLYDVTNMLLVQFFIVFLLFPR
jgi:hypothetical protein